LATQKFDAMVASGKLVDMMFLAGTGLADLVNQGAIADIKDIWERTASDLVKEKKKYANDSRNWFHVLRNGGSEVYGIPFNHGPAYNVDNLGWIRKDLLDEAGLSVPETLDQLETALYAFKDKGLTEYGINCCKNLVTWYNSLDPIFAAYGVMPTFWMKRGSTPLTYGSTLPEVKDVLARLAKWYKDGIIHPDYYTFGEGDADANITSGKVGAFFSAHWVVPGTLTMAEQGLNCQFAMMPSPKGPSGLMGRKSSGISDNAICFAHDIDPIKIEAAINWLNWQTERAVNIDRNNDYGMLGPDISEYMFNQGIGWVWDDAASECKIKTGPGQWSAWWTYYGFHYPGYYWDEFQAEAAEVVMSWAKKDPVDLNSVQKWILAPERNILRFLEAYKHNIDTGKERIENEWYGIPGESMLEFSGDLGTLEAEAFTAIVTGQKPLEAFDQFVTDWYSNGGNEITMEVNEWYKNKS
jgi:putative aldouronate transport system substrate-binding protein